MICGESRQHYVWLKHPNRVLKTHYGHPSLVCHNCCAVFYKNKEKRLAKHQETCLQNKPCTIKFPHESQIKYRQYGLQCRQEFVAYADFEAINKKFINDTNSGFEEGGNEEEIKEEEEEEVEEEMDVSEIESIEDEGSCRWVILPPNDL